MTCDLPHKTLRKVTASCSTRYDYSENMIVDEGKYLAGKRVQESNHEIHPDFTWIGLVDPTEPELKILQNRFHLNSLAVEDALSNTQRPKLDQYREHSMLLLKTIAYDSKTQKIAVGDITIFFTQNYLLTVRHGSALPLGTIRADLESHPNRLSKGTTAVLHEIVDRLVDEYLKVCAFLANDLNSLEDSVFDDDKPASASDLYFVKRELVEFRRAVIPLLQPIDQFVSGKAKGVDGEWIDLFSDIRDHLLKVIDEVGSMNEIMDAALHANLALVQTQQNADMRKISAWVGLGAVPTMVAGIYGMNFKYLPELNWRYGYFVVIGGLILVCGVLFRLFHKYEWL